MGLLINRRRLLVAMSGLQLFLGWIAVTSQAGSAAEGGTISSDDTFFVQGTVDSQDRPVYLATETFQGSITQCLDSYCRNSTTAVVPDLFRGEGFALLDSGRAVILGEPDDFAQPNSIIVCSDPSCSNVESVTPAPASGILFAPNDSSLLIVNRRTVTQCLDLSCDFARTFDHGVSNFQGVTFDGSELVFLTGDSIVRCTDLCEFDRTATPHGIVGASDISIGSDGLPRISARRAITDSGDYVPELHLCLDANCNQAEVEVLGFGQNARTTFSLIDGDPIRAVVSNDVTSRVDSQLLVSTPLRCSATISGNNISVSFDGDAGRAAILRIDGRFVEVVTGRDQASATFASRFPTAGIRTWFGDIFIDVPCIEDGDGLEGGPGPEGGPGMCIVERSGGVATIRYDVGSSTSLNLRGDNRWIATLSPDQRSFVVAVPRDSFTLVRRDGDGVRTDQVCTEAGAPTDPDAVMCTISPSGRNDVLITWDNAEDGIVVLRSDGRWLATPDGDSFTAVNADISSDFILRLHRFGGSEDTTCLQG